MEIAGASVWNGGLVVGGHVHLSTLGRGRWRCLGQATTRSSNVPVSQNTLIGIMWVLTAGHERL